MFLVYILYSGQLDKFYVGFTEDLDLRIDQHNSGFFKNSWTTRTDDWVLFYFIKCSSKTQAIKIERHIKNMKSKKYYFDLKKYPTISERLKEKYKD